MPTSDSAKAAMKPRRSSEPKAIYSSTDSMALTNPAPESGDDYDSEAQLTGSNDEHLIDEDDKLLDEIAKQLEGEEETFGALGLIYMSHFSRVELKYCGKKLLSVN